MYKMGSQYKQLKNDDIEFINKQKLFYIASCSSKEVNLSPKGYDCIKVLNNNTLVFMSYHGSGNRTNRDTTANGEFTLVFNSFEEEAKILRLFCKSKMIEHNSNNFEKYVSIFGVNKNIVRDFFIFDIYAVESSCGMSVPYMEYKGERNNLKNWNKDMAKKDKLSAYKEKNFTPVDLNSLS